MFFPGALLFRCMLAILAIQIAVYLIFVNRLSHQNRYTNISKINYSSKTEIELYMSEDLNITETNDDDDCAKKFLDSYSRYCEKAIVPSLKVREQYYKSFGDWLSKDLCPCLPQQNLTGKVDLNMSSVKLSAEIFNGLRPGGHWAPSWCIPRQRIAIIIPFRDRASHLDLFLQIFHPFLQNQLHSYSIFVIEQKDPEIFNKASMMNIGFVEVTKRSERVFDCFIFHDVDTLPQDDRNIYGCYKVPRHVAAYIDKLKYRLLYVQFLGGAAAFTKRQFELLNGYSNEFWGWGGEDDDMGNRLKAVNLSCIRFPKCVAKYKMIKHVRDKGNPINKWKGTGHRYRPELYKRNGLNSLQYTLIGYEERLLYTKIIASLPITDATETTRRPKSPTRTSFTSMVQSSAVETSTYNNV